MRTRESASPPGHGSRADGRSSSDTPPQRKSSTSPSGSSPHSGSQRRSGSGSSSGSPRDLSPPLLAELANMSVNEVIQRPDVGQAGRKIALASNFYPIQLRDPTMMVFHYHVEVHHPQESRKLDRDELRLIFWETVREHKDIFTHKYSISFDGNHILFTPKRIDFPEGRSTWKLETDVCLARDSKERTRCAVTFQLVGPIVMDVAKARAGNVEERQLTPIQILDIVLRQGLSCPLLEYASAFYGFKSSVYKIPSPNEALSLGAGIELWTGFYTSANVTTNNRPLLNIDVSNTAFYKARISMIDFMCEALNEKAGGGGGMGGGMRGRGGPLMRGGRGGGAMGGGGGDGPYQAAAMNESTTLSQHEFRIVADAVKGLRVRVSHKPGQLRIYRVNALAESADTLTFSMNEQEKERKLSVAQYFEERYGKLRYPRLPCLHVGAPQRRIYFPIEACDLDWPLKVARKLNEKQTSTVIRSSAVDAETRRKKIADLARLANYDKDPFLASFGIQVGADMVTLDGRVLRPPKIQYKQREIEPRDGAWDRDMPNQILLEPARCASYAVISLVSERENANLQDFCKQLHQKAGQMGLTQFPAWPDLVKHGRGREDIPLLFREIIAEYEAQKATCELIIVVMAAKNSDIYVTVKESSEVVFGIMSQCLLLKTATRPGSQTLANIILKINAKLGGVNCKNVPDEISTKYMIGVPTLILGVDVTHPTAMEERQGIPSVASVVGNLDMLPMKYGSNVKVQKKTRESVVYLLDAVRERLVHFYKVTQLKPSRIIVYRDGVSEGQFVEVLREELQGIRTACMMLASDYRPPITYIVTQKRHHARLFCQNGREAVGKARNVPPGTVVDTAIVSPTGYDFYLCSHFGIQGTSRPTHYHVLWDDSGMSSDEVQALTYQLCHTYVRCARTVSIPAPAYYAHLVATRARCHIKRKLGMESESASFEGGRGTRKTATRSVTGTETETTDTEEESAKGGAAGHSGSSHSSDSALQECVQVVDKFKGRMYFV